MSAQAQEQFLRKVCDVEPRFEVRQMVFPARRVVFAVVLEEIGELTVPFTAEQARKLGETLLEFAARLAENEGGDWN
jgi:hypothetical protein